MRKYLGYLLARVRCNAWVLFHLGSCELTCTGGGQYYVAAVRGSMFDDDGVKVLRVFYDA